MVSKLKEQNITIKENFRRIGIGITGWADILVDLNLSYIDNKSLKLAEKVMKNDCWCMPWWIYKTWKEKDPLNLWSIQNGLNQNKNRGI